MKVVPQGAPAAGAAHPPATADARLARRTQRILDGPILPTLLRLALPNIIVVLVQSASSAVDAFYLGRLGPDVLASVALVFPLWTLMVTMSAGGMGGGIASSIARALGAGRRDQADALVGHSLVLAGAFALAFTTAILVGGPRLFAAMGGRGVVLSDAVAYADVVFAGALAIWLLNATAAVMRGSGEMLVPALVIIVGEVVHVVLAPLLIFGLGPFPALGVSGAALSLVISYVARAVALGAHLLMRRAPVHLPARPLRLQRRLFWEILRVGVPGSLNSLMTNANVLLTTSFVATSGVFALAGFGLAARLEFLLIPLVFGFGAALVTMVGTSVGSGDVRRARRVSWIGAAVAGMACGAIGLVAAFAPHIWVDLFTGDAAVLDAGAAYLRVVAPTYPFFGVGLALYFAAQGAGRLGWPLLAGLARLLVTLVGGWTVIGVLHLDLIWLYAVVALAFVTFGVGQALAANLAIRSSR